MRFFSVTGREKLSSMPVGGGAAPAAAAAGAPAAAEEKKGTTRLYKNTSK